MTFIYFVHRTLFFQKTNIFSPKWLLQKSTITTKSKKTNSSFLLNIFKGRIIKSEVLPYPEALNKEQIVYVKNIIDSLKKILIEKNDALLNDKQNEVPNSILQELWKMGVFGITVPKKFGGLGLSKTQYVKIISILGKHDIGLAILATEHQGTGFKGISVFGTEAQKLKYLTRVTKGEFASLCWKERESGGDMMSIKTKATLSSDKKYYILNGTKRWVANAGTSKIFVVLCQIENLEKVSTKLSTLIVEKSFGGISISESQMKMGLSVLSVADVTFKDVKVPIDNVLGKLADGHNITRTIVYGGTAGVPSIMLGAMKSCINSVIDFTSESKRFERHISEFSPVRIALARMLIAHYVSQAMTYLLAGNIDKGSVNIAIESMACKCFTTDAAWCVCDTALQLFGEHGYMSKSGLELTMRNVRAFRIYSGVNEFLKILIALDGIRYSTAKEGEEEKVLGHFIGTGTVDPYITDIVKFQDSFNTKELLEMAHPELHNATRLLIEAIEKFVLTLQELINKYHKLILEEIVILTEFANIAILIYACVATFSRTSRALYLKSDTANFEKEIAECFCKDACFKIHAKINCIISPDFRAHLKKVETIALETYRAKKVLYESPIGI